MHEVELPNLICLAPRPRIGVIVCPFGQAGQELRHQYCVQVIQVPAQSLPASMYSCPYILRQLL